MDKHVKKLSAIDYEGEDILGQLNKRFKYTEQDIIDDITSSIESVARSTKSIAENHAVFLEVNKALVLFLLEREKENKEKLCEIKPDTLLLQREFENNTFESTQ